MYQKFYSSKKFFRQYLVSVIISFKFEFPSHVPTNSLLSLLSLPPRPPPWFQEIQKVRAKRNLFLSEELEWELVNLRSLKNEK